MHPCEGNCVAIVHAVYFFSGLATHLVQELSVGSSSKSDVYHKKVLLKLLFALLILNILTG